MARPRAFDEAEVLDRAAELFRERGYEATSICNLEEHLGLRRQSLYNAFGGKHELFVRALDRYTLHNDELLRDTLLRPGGGVSAIRRYFRELIRFLTAPGPRKGCLVANSIVEMADPDPEVQTRCRRTVRGLRDALSFALEGAVEFGELPPGFDVEEGTNLLLALVWGLAVQSKVGVPARELRETAESLIDRL